MRKFVPLGVLGLLLASVPLLIGDDDYLLKSCVFILLHAYLATSWNIVGGFAGQLSFGHAAFMALGGYISTLLFMNLGLTPWVGMIIGGIVVAAVSVLIGIPTFRFKGAYFAIATVAFSGGLLTILKSVPRIGPIELGSLEGLIIPLQMDGGFASFQFLTSVPYYYIILVLTAVVLFVSWYIERSKLGFYLTAIREDEEAAKALGISTSRVKLYAAAISGFFTAIGGTFFGQLMGILQPDTVAGPEMSTQMVFNAIVGGIGTVFGPFIGAILLGTVGEVSRVYLGDGIPGLHLIIYGVIVTCVILFCPKGIVGPLQHFFFTRLAPALSSKKTVAIGSGERRKHDGSTPNN
ncbi:branched-chain amino acid ABC transporter permease [Paenibacillus xerothermodurans]|uniref:Branched-chain amino acid ABC transporter permease n=1 Tax=Paenibacillus xerothermodurans TaxID=1977292 RepID=A0A2W1NE00_PAEXE|nr:branched-chain amino acid ABC transporter permease [Paenibacillus xerothermodurans]PZE22747.1 branched-chain amino acid ABC transporter permease [Paenibacillus xerothermodurans]